MKRVMFALALYVLFVPACFSEIPQFAGGSFSGSLQDAVSVVSAKGLAQISFSGYGYASLTDRFFIGGFGEGFGGQDTTSGYGGLALGLWLGHGQSAWYLLSFTGVGLLGYRNVPYFGMVEEASINRGIFLSNRFLLSLYLGITLQANLSEGVFEKYLAFAPVLGGRIDFGRYATLAR
jgi:hypothetical protein